MENTVALIQVVRKNKGEGVAKSMYDNIAL